MLKHQSPGGFIEVFHSKCLNQRARHLGLRVGGLNFPSARRIRCTPIAHCVRLLITLYVCLMAVNDRAEKERERNCLLSLTPSTRLKQIETEEHLQAANAN